MKSYKKLTIASAIALTGFAAGNAQALSIGDTATACYTTAASAGAPGAYVTLKASYLGGLVPASIVGNSQFDSFIQSEIPQQAIFSLSGKAVNVSGFVDGRYDFGTVTGTAVIGRPDVGVLMNLSGSNGINGLETNGFYTGDVTNVATSCHAAGSGKIFPDTLYCRSVVLNLDATNPADTPEIVAGELELERIDIQTTDLCANFYVPPNPVD